LSYEQELFLQADLFDYLGISDEGFAGATIRVDQVKNNYKSKIREQLVRRIKTYKNKDTIK